MKKRLLWMLVCCLVICQIPAVSASAKSSSTPLQKNGQLRVKGTKLVNSKGETVILKGVSTHGINWFPQYVNKSAFQSLRDDWGVNCVRLAMYTEEYNGYCSGGSQSELKKLINNGEICDRAGDVCDY